MGNPINKAWHEENVMPQNPPMDVRIEWHRRHQVECACRAIPASVLAAMSGGAEPQRASKKKTASAATNATARRAKPTLKTNISVK
jgi:hypothetical protein